MRHGKRKTCKLITGRNPLSIQVCFNITSPSQTRTNLSIVVIPYQFRSVSIEEMVGALGGDLALS